MMYVNQEQDTDNNGVRVDTNKIKNEKLVYCFTNRKSIYYYLYDGFENVNNCCLQR